MVVQRRDGPRRLREIDDDDEWHQMDHMHSRQITTPTANHSFLQAGCSS